MPIKFKDAEGNEHEIPTAQETTDMITGAVKKHTKTLSDDITKKMGDVVASSLAETLTTFEGKIDSKLEEKTKELKVSTTKVPANTDLDIENHPKFKGLEKRLADLDTKAKDAELREKAAEAKQRDLSLRSSVQEKLGKLGFDSKKMHLVMGAVVDAQKRVRFQDDDGDAIVFRGDDGEEVDIDTGLAAWAKTEDAKTFMPPRGASGSGDRPGGKAPPAGGSTGKGNAASMLTASILGAVDHAQGFPVQGE